MRRVVLGLSLFLAACLPLEGSSPVGLQPHAAPSGEMMVSMEDFEFRPGTLRVPPGTTVVFVNRGQHPHTATEGRGLFDSGILAPGGSFRHTFSTPGEYTIYCKLHPYMVLRVGVGP